MKNNNQTFVKLEGARNWNTWKFQMRVILRGHQLFDVVEGRIVKPEPTKTAEVTAWELKDSKVQALIVTRLTEDVMLHVISRSTAAEIWKKLCGVYEQKSETSVHIIQQRFFQYKYEDGTSMATYLSKIQKLQNKQLGEKISEKFVINKVLMTLPDRYKHYVSAWESTPDDKQTFDNLVARLMIEEERMGAGNTPGTSCSTSAFVAAKVDKKM